VNVYDDSWTQVARDAGLPADTEPLVVKDNYAVARSMSKRLVFRIGLRGASNFDLNPSDLSHGHRIAVDMAQRGLNVLAPLTSEPTAAGHYLISATPLAIPLTDAPWTLAEAAALGRDLLAWSGYGSPLLARLDIPGYVRSRSYDAINAGGATAAAGEWCLATLEALDARAPFAQLVETHPGTIHGDVHTGNLVRHEGRLLLIDLDSVKAGPAMFDIAVGLMYERRYSPRYPGTAVAAGYLSSRVRSNDDELAALQQWKELSSYSQLLLRWHQGPEVAVEFWRRTHSGWKDHWNNIVQTPLQGTAETRPE
jgi:hypothetical protein